MCNYLRCPILPSMPNTLVPVQVLLGRIARQCFFERARNTPSTSLPDCSSACSLLHDFTVEVYEALLILPSLSFRAAISLQRRAAFSSGPLYAVTQRAAALARQRSKVIRLPGRLARRCFDRQPEPGVLFRMDA